MENIFSKIDNTTCLLTGLIVGIAIIFRFYILYQKNNSKLLSNRRWIEQIPSFVSTLGVFGTFFGITKGLLDFDSMQLEKSIPQLLDGLKTAFFTSLVGMVGSLWLSRVISKYYDKQDDGVSDINIAAGEIVKAVKAMSESNQATLNELKQQAIQQANNQSAFYVTCGNVLKAIKDSVESSENNMNSMVLQIQAQTNNLSDIKENTDGVLRTVGTIELHEREQSDSLETVQRTLQDTSPHISSMATNVGEIVDITSAIAGIEDEVSAEVKNFGDKLHSEVLEIEDKMKETNKLLEEKFNEFSELLKKSNTEALVEVMKKVTAEFQKQMNALINKLIQENFDQLTMFVKNVE